MIVFVIANLESSAKDDAGLTDNLLIPLKDNFVFLQEGKGSWYGGKFHLRQTASGEVYDMNLFTAAHKTLPFGTIARVRNIEKNRSVLFRVTDRGPFTKNRIVDLSYKCAQEADIYSNGTGDIVLDCILPETSLPLTSDSDDFYIAYSYNYPLLLVHKNAIFKICYTHSFDDAVEYYSAYANCNPEKNLFLLVPVNQRVCKSAGQNDFFIGVYTDKPFSLPSPVVNAINQSK